MINFRSGLWLLIMLISLLGIVGTNGTGVTFFTTLGAGTIGAIANDDNQR